MYELRQVKHVYITEFYSYLQEPQLISANLPS